MWRRSNSSCPSDASPPSARCRCSRASRIGIVQPAAAHVLHLGDLVDDLAERVEDEIGEHEIDDRPRAGHRRAARRGRRSRVRRSACRTAARGRTWRTARLVVLKLPPRSPMPSPITKMRGFARHLVRRALRAWPAMKVRSRRVRTQESGRQERRSLTPDR